MTVSPGDDPPTGIAMNRLCFHEHNGRCAATACVLYDIMGPLKSDIFPTCVFNNIVGLSCIFGPRGGGAGLQSAEAISFIFTSFHFCADVGCGEQVTFFQTYNGRLMVFSASARLPRRESEASSRSAPQVPHRQHIIFTAICQDKSLRK